MGHRCCDIIWAGEHLAVWRQMVLSCVPSIYARMGADLQVNMYFGKFATSLSDFDFYLVKYLFLEYAETLICTANVLSVEIADVCLQSKSKDSHWLFLHVSVCDWLQKFVCCFNVISKAKSTEKWTLFIQNYRYLFVLLANFFHNVKFSQFFYCI